MEVMSQLEVALDEGYIDGNEFASMETIVAETARVISGLQNIFGETMNNNSPL